MNGPPKTARNLDELGSTERWLIAVMQQNQFGRIENLRVRGGTPVIDSDVRVVRVSRLGAGSTDESRKLDQGGLSPAIRDLLRELVSLGDGFVIRIEFRHGLPCLIETVTGPQRT